MIRSLCLAAMLFVTTGAGAAPRTCPDPRFSVEGEDHGAVCEAAARAARQLASCNLPVTKPLEFELVDSLGEGCLGVYHCGQNRIQLLRPGAYAGLIGPESAFYGIESGAFFESVVRHEMAHAALDDMPCPFGGCMATQEYVAYSMQVMFLPADAVSVFEAGIDPGQRAHRDRINTMILMMDPKVFARNAWMHLSQRPDPCAYIGQIAAGSILFDVERP